MKNFKQIDYTTDKKIIGNGNAFLCEILNKEFKEFKELNNRNLLMHFQNFKIADDFNKIPNNLIGKIAKRKLKPDFYNVSPFFFGLDFIVSEKVKLIFEKLEVSNEEFFFREINIKNSSIILYLLLIPTLDFTQFQLDYSKSEFFNTSSCITRQFNNFEDLLNMSDYYKYHLLKGYINHSLINNDIVSLRGISRPYFSERLIQSLLENDVIGLEVYENRVLYVQD